MYLSALVGLFSIPALVAGAAIPVPSKSFSGKGQLRTRWNEGDYADLGCLTDHGRWTSDESLCGTFTANQYTTGTYAQVAFTLTSASGPCNMLGGRLDCEPGNEPYKYFGVRRAICPSSRRWLTNGQRL
jgi:hypothetical protein